MRLSHFSSPVLTVALAAAALASACGASDDAATDEATAVAMTRAQLEQHVVDHYQPKKADTPYTAKCAGDLAASEAATQECTVTTPDQQVGVEAQVTDADDLGVEMTPFLPASAVEESIAGSLEMQGYTDVEAVCGGDLVGEVGHKIVCAMSVADTESDVDVEVTAVDALQIDFAFKSA